MAPSDTQVLMASKEESNARSPTSVVHLLPLNCRLRLSKDKREQNTRKGEQSTDECTAMPSNVKMLMKDSATN